MIQPAFERVIQSRNFIPAAEVALERKGFDGLHGVGFAEAAEQCQGEQGERDFFHRDSRGFWWGGAVQCYQDMVLNIALKKYITYSIFKLSEMDFDDVVSRYCRCI